MTDTTRDALNDAIMKHLGPAALTGGKMSILEAFELGWQAATEQGKPQWLPIADAPRDGTEYWATDGTHHFTESKPPKCFPGQWKWFEKERSWGGSMSTYKATHFMPLPLPPTATPQGKI